MGKSDFGPLEPRLSFSHGRTKPVIVEKLKRRVATPALGLCSSCGSRMKLLSDKLTASCPRCSAHNNE